MSKHRNRKPTPSEIQKLGYKPLSNYATSTRHAPGSAAEAKRSAKRERYEANNAAYQARKMKGSASYRRQREAKRASKHEILMTRVRDSGISKTPTPKTRRPAKKMEATQNLREDLTAALPDLSEEDEDDNEEEWGGLSDTNPEGAGQKRRRRGNMAANGKMQMKSLKHKPGAMKRKRRLEQGEMERFGRNLAQMAVPVQGSGVDEGRGAQQGRKWEALRAFIGTTMERDRVFAGVS